MKLGNVLISITIFLFVIGCYYFDRYIKIRCEKKLIEENTSRLEKIYEDTKKVYKRKTDFDNLDTDIDLKWLRTQRISN